MVMFEIKTKWIKYFRRLRLERILASCTTLVTLFATAVYHYVFFLQGIVMLNVKLFLFLSAKNV